MQSFNSLFFIWWTPRHFYVFKFLTICIRHQFYLYSYRTLFLPTAWFTFRFHCFIRLRIYSRFIHIYLLFSIFIPFFNVINWIISVNILPLISALYVALEFSICQHCQFYDGSCDKCKNGWRYNVWHGSFALNYIIMNWAKKIANNQLNSLLPNENDWTKKINKRSIDSLPINR